MAVYFLLLLLSIVPLFQARLCPTGKYCPAGYKCGIHENLCEFYYCPPGGNVGSWTTDCEPAVSISFTQATYEVDENETAKKVQPVLALNKALECCSVSVFVRLDDITATQDRTSNCGKGSDYGSSSLSRDPYIRVVFPAGVKTVPFEVPIIDDNLVEGDERFRLTIEPTSIPHGVTAGSPLTAQVIIKDDDYSKVEFKSSQYSVNEYADNLRVQLSLSAQSSNNISVVVEGKLVNAIGCDYDAGPHIVTFPACQTTASLNVDIIDDDIYEESEIFNLVIKPDSLPLNVGEIILGSRYKSSVTIRDDERAISITFDQTSYKVPEQSGPVKVTLDINDPSPCCFNIIIKLQDITATGGKDYGTGYNMSEFTFPAGVTCASFDIPIYNDREPEIDEKFKVIIVEKSLPFGVVFGRYKEATVTIVDNDYGVYFDKPTYNVKENARSVQTVLRLTEPINKIVSVQVLSTDRDATGDVDYVSKTHNVTFLARQTRATLNILMIDDCEVENDEVFYLTIDNSTLPFDIVPTDPYRTAVTIEDDEYTLCFNASVYDVDEYEGRVQLVLTLNKPLPSSLSVQLKYHDLTTNEISRYKDYSALTRVTFPRGKTTHSFYITITKDTILETIEAFTVTAVPPKSCLVNDSCSARVNIFDDDELCVKFERSSYTFHDKNDQLNSRLILSGFASFPIYIRVDEIDGTAKGGSDYQYQNYITEFEPYTTKSNPLVLDPIDDDIVEPDEEYYLTINDPSLPSYVGVCKPPNTTVTIKNDDKSTMRIEEGNLHFIKALSEGFTVHVTYTDGNSIDINVPINPQTQATNERIPLGGPRSDISKVEVCLHPSIERFVSSLERPKVIKKC